MHSDFDYFMLPLIIHCFSILSLSSMVTIFFINLHEKLSDLFICSLTKVLNRWINVQFKERIFLKLKSRGGPLRFYITFDDYFFINDDKFQVYKLFQYFINKKEKIYQSNLLINQFFNVNLTRKLREIYFNLKK